MKIYFTFLTLLLFLSFSTLLQAQCIPDNTVTDTDLPGEIFPLELHFKQGVPTTLKLTIIPPPTAVNGSMHINLVKIVLRGLQNKPSWLGYSSNAVWVETGNDNPVWGYEFVVGQKYCINLWGVPPAGSFTGLDSMGVMVDAYIGTISNPILVGNENTNGGYVKFSICQSTDTTCWPEKIIDPAELVFKQGMTFSNTLSYVPPSQMSYSGSFYNLSKVVVREITGLPSWVTYSINAPTISTGTSTPVTGYEMLTGKKYTINFSGIPDTSFFGSSNLVFKMDPYLHNGNLIAENINGEQIPYRVCRAADTECYPTGIKEIKTSTFKLISFNPFISENSAQIKFYSEKNKSVTLQVYDLLGKPVYSSTMQAIYGTNNFQFSCTEFPQGAYVFIISDHQSVLTGKLIKAQEK